MAFTLGQQTVGLHTKKKSHPWPEKAPNGSDAEAISMVA
jgi:hypothetical protein